MPTRRTLAATLLALTLIATGYGLSTAVAAATPKAVKVCVTKKFVVVSAAKNSRCPSGTTLVKVSRRGPVGPVGPPGPTGPQGPPGTTAFGTNTGGAGNAQNYNCVLGTISLTASSFRGNGVPAKGQELSINNNSALFTLIGWTYGGNGVTTFRLPDLRDAAPDNMTYTICTQGIFPGEG
ncbi:phage tail protein [Nocardioides sp.]|uniref:phage tail protein n=1 Tax=Nocardioides sp. TaxID=35761 RepID=UPI002736876C|nr:phage tail protein [Nocardioides sp.]MDP3894638.1 phage tail protein [Nocardioides sp.]